MLNQVFNQETNVLKVAVLEDFLVKKLIDKDITLVENFISIMAENPDKTITEIAAELGVSSKTINRQFAKSIGCSPMEYKKLSALEKQFKRSSTSPLKT